MEQSLSQIRAAAGRKGGISTVQRHGTAHMKKIGRRGAQVFHARYKLEPIDLNDFVIVHRETDEAVALLSGKPLGWTPWTHHKPGDPS